MYIKKIKNLIKDTSTFYQNNCNLQNDKKLSKIGSRIFSSEDQAFFDYQNITEQIDDESECKGDLENDYEYLKKYDIYSNIFRTNKEIEIKINLIIKNKLNKSSNFHEELFFLNLKANEKTKISEIILKSVDSFNEKFKNENFIYLLNHNYSNYQMRPSKKNGNPKSDIPGNDII